MNIIYLCKRQYMRKDVLDDRYGRMYEMPLELSRSGVQVSCFSLSYRTKTYFNGELADRLHWVSIDLNALNPGGLIRMVRELLAVIKESKPDAIVASSDVIHLATGRYISKKTGVPLISDLYDNFESYGISRLPLMQSLYKNALRNSAAVACVSQPLSEYIKSYCSSGCKIEVIENAVDLTVFKPLSMAESRSKLSLPEHAVLIGTAGELNESRGIGTFYRAYEKVLKKRPNVHLVLAGSLSDTEPPPTSQNVHYLGELEHSLIAGFYNALDLAVVPLTDSAFGRYCYPQKACEILACQRPLLASSVGVMKSLLKAYPECLFDDGDADMLSKQIIQQLEHPQVPALVPQSWTEQAEKLKQLILSVS